MPQIDTSKPATGPVGLLARLPVRLPRVIIAALAGLFVCYHAYTLVHLYLGAGTTGPIGADLYGGSSAGEYAWYVHTQSILRVFIIASLVLVAMNRRSALYGMWAAISALVGTHYWAYFFDLPFQFLAGKHPLSYLKGFIMPTVVTLLFLSANLRSKHGNVGPNCPLERPCPSAGCVDRKPHGF